MYLLAVNYVLLLFVLYYMTDGESPRQNFQKCPRQNCPGSHHQRGHVLLTAGVLCGGLELRGAPEIKSAWARVVANQCSEARQQAISVYDQELLVALRTSAVGKVESDVGMDVLLPVTTQTLLGCHETAKMRSKEFFRSKVKNVILRNITIYL
jgi:hypothetical protein